MLESVPVRAWQVINARGDVRILLAGAAGVDDALVARAFVDALERAGAVARSVVVERVDAIAKGALGKTALVVNER